MTAVLRLARKLCHEYGTTDPFALCKELGIGVLYCALPQTVEGLYLKWRSQKVLMLNGRLSRGQARIVCAHELGHALLHEDYNVLYLQAHTLFNCGRYEREADLFCAALLIGDAAESCADQTLTVQQIAASTGLSEDLVQLWAEQMERGDEQ